MSGRDGLMGLRQPRSESATLPFSILRRRRPGRRSPFEVQHRSPRNENLPCRVRPYVARVLHGLGCPGTCEDGGGPSDRAAGSRPWRRREGDRRARRRRSRRPSTRATPRPPPRPTRRTALVVDEQGERTEGRAAIRDQLAAVVRRQSRQHDRHPGATRSASSARRRRSRRAGRRSRRPRAPGRPRSPASPSSTSSKDGQWLQAAVRDELAHDLTPHDRLKELEWLVGRLGQREPGRGRLHHLQVGQRRQLPGPRVHHEDRRASPCSRARSGSAGTR